MFRLLSTEEDLQSNREEIISELNEKIQRLDLNATLVFDGHYRYGLGSRSPGARVNDWPKQSLSKSLSIGSILSTKKKAVLQKKIPHLHLKLPYPTNSLLQTNLLTFTFKSLKKNSKKTSRTTHL